MMVNNTLSRGLGNITNAYFMMVNNTLSRGLGNITNAYFMMVNNTLSRGLGNITNAYFITGSQSTCFNSKLKKYALSGTPGHIKCVPVL